MNNEYILKLCPSCNTMKNMHPSWTYCNDCMCGYMILTPTPEHNGGMWCANPKPCKEHDKTTYGKGFSEVSKNCPLCHFEPENGHAHTCPNRKETNSKVSLYSQKDVNKTEDWEERFKKGFCEIKFGDGTLKGGGKAAWLSIKKPGMAMGILQFIRQIRQEAYDEEANNCHEHCNKAKEEERSRILKLIEGMKCKVPESPKGGLKLTDEYVNKSLVYVGRFNYNKSLEDILSTLKEEIIKGK